MKGLGVLVSQLTRRNGWKQKTFYGSKKKKKQCHTGNVYVFSIGNVEIYGGGKTRSFDPDDADILLPTLSGYDQSGNSLLAKVFPRYSKIHKEQIVLPVITRDGSPPSLSRAEWKAIIADLKDIQEKQKLLTFCVGGHGRTGTILSVLYGLTHPNSGDPVKKVRELYCDNAVETNSQLDYIEAVTGIKVNSGPSKPYYGNYSYKSKSNGGSKKDDKPGYHKMFKNSAWKDMDEKEVSWVESGLYKGYEYTKLGKQSLYRKKR